MTYRHRTYERTAGKDTATAESPKHVNKAKIPNRKKRFGIEIRYPLRTGLGRDGARWHQWKWYENEKRRDQALERLVNNPCNVYKRLPPESRPQYRKIDR